LLKISKVNVSFLCKGVGHYYKTEKTNTHFIHLHAPTQADTLAYKRTKILANTQLEILI